MIRGLDAGIRRAVTATLRERGFSEGVAKELAGVHLADATRFFHGRLAVHQMGRKPIELALDDSFVDLSRWAAELASALPSSAVTAAAAPGG